MRRLATALFLGAPLLLTACDSADNDGPPRRALVTAVQIDDGPLVDVNGEQWDGTGGGGPEIYFRLLYADDPTTAAGVLNPRDDAFVVNRSNPGQAWYDDVRSSTFPLVWDVEGEFEVRDLREDYRVVLYDYDPTTSDDVMISTRTFTFDEEAPTTTDGREDTITLEGEGADENEVQVRLRVVYDD